MGMGEWGDVGQAWATTTTAYPDVGVPTPRTSSRGSSRGSGSRPSSSRPSTAGSSRGGRGTLYDDVGLSRPGTAGERIEMGYLQKLREEAGLVVDNPNDEMDWDDDLDDVDAEILELIERNESGLAKIREDLITANKELSAHENTPKVGNESKVSASVSASAGGGTKGLSVR
ncbi:hypothetical protein TrRE_jg9517 [Triparma retinervis]|uniref:Uncharacterized protein n=1 Tax=Triparma retinervis TaxID=2557542 RepID=A0A9W7F4H4_9STRA|nr:hypothetical protein TrRE_jg9517 [Triparma retinervis]